MSWETLIVGTVKFKEGIEKAKIIEAKEELESALEASIEYDEKYNEYKFQGVNWVSHVKGEEIKEVVEKHKNTLSYFSCSLYYLNEPHETVDFEEKSREVEAALI